MSTESDLAKNVLQRIQNTPQATKVKMVIAAVSIAILGIGGYFLWQHLHPPQPVTTESQQQAETPAGVDLAAKDAHIDMLQSQLIDAARQIAALKNQPPKSVVQTIPVQVPYVIEQQREKAGADFAIVTDPANPSKQVDIKQVQQLPANTTVTLNQYNVQAYPQRIAEVSYYSNNSGDVAYMSRVKVFGKTGYIGPAIKYDDNKIAVGARVSVPF